ncbi:hypothetical protein C1646_134189 [Rhizophagus diaphanus]|nr:hypothetical protein C1646_134189 [Rhizophagus diaphanus] [Rhizophagus sp. MUCL 43196]
MVSKSNLNSIPTQSDILKQTSIQSKFPNSAGVIVNISATSCPSIGSKGTNVTGLVNSISVFRTLESPNTNGDINNSLLNNKTKNGKIWKGKGKANLKANKVSFTVNRQMYMCPSVMQQLSCALMLVTQRMDKREKEMEKLKNGEKDTVPLFNPKSQNDEQSTNGPTVTSSTSEPLSKEPAESSIPERSNQKRKGSLTQPNNMNIDVVVIDSDSNSEIDVEETDDIPSKPLLRKPSLDSSQLNPISKRPKPSKYSSNHVQVNGNSSSIQSNKSPHLPSSFLPESPTFSPSPLVPNSSTIHITVPNNSSTGTPNGSQFSQVNYQYPKYVTNGFRTFHNGPEDLNLRSPTSPNGNKIVNVSQSSGIHLPSIQAGNNKDNIATRLITDTASFTYN